MAERPILVPVLPLGHRGMALATTRRLVEVKARYRALATDPAADPVLRRYSRNLLAEIAAELRRRNGKGVAA